MTNDGPLAERNLPNFQGEWRIRLLIRPTLANPPYALLLLDFRSSNSQGNADGIITSAVLSRAGAIAMPSEKPTDIAAPETVAVSERARH